MILRTIWGAITKPFKVAYKVLPGFRDGAAKWVQTMAFYLAFGAIIIFITRLPMIPNWAEILVAVSCGLLLSFVTVIRTRVSVSETDIQIIQKQKTELEEELEKERSQVAKLKDDMRKQRTRLLDMNWIWEVNLAEVRLERIKLFDYFLRGKEDPIPWTNRPEKLKEHDKRAIGALKIDYTAKIGIDLKQVLVHHDSDKNLVQYWIPEPYQTGAVDPSDTWAIRTAMTYTSGQSTLDIFNDWRWHDEESKNTALPIWELEKTERYKDAFASQALSDQLGTAIHNEAENRLKAFFEVLLGCKAIAVSKEQLTQPDTLGVLLPAMMKEKVPLIEAA